MDSFIGKMLDNRYEILEVIGSGGMAVVYKALCHRLNRFVAVKILKADMAQDADFRRRFHAESQAVAMLSHPNIVAVYDVSRSSEIEYIVMELIDGITLKQYMQRKGVLSWRETLHFSTQIVKALSHAHNRGIIHRDIKPHNMMVLRDGSVKVADLGIARLPSVQNTLTQEALGSVHYISPEQARGSHIDGRSDIYSLGVVMYEMLTGRLPFEGDSAVTVAIQHINSAPLWPREVNPDIPEPLEAITMKAMCASLGKRYLSAEEMLHDLEEFRKNPNITFEFETKKFPDYADDGLEPTQTLPKTRALQPQAQTRQPAPARNPRMIEPDEDYERKRKAKRLTLLTGVVAVLVFIAGMAMLIGQLIGIGSTGPSPSASGEDIVLESLIGKSFAEASEQYKDQLVLERSAEAEHHDYYEEDVIIRQDTSPGTKLQTGDTVIVTVSKGKESFSLLKLAGHSETDAQVKLIGLGLKYDSQYESSDTIVKDQVIRTEPEAGEEVRKGDTITLIVSSGPDIKMTTVPNLVGVQETDVRRLLERNNLLRGGTTEEFSDKPVGEVLSHTPKADDEVPEKSAVDIVVSKGPAVSPTPSETPSPSSSEDLITLPVPIRFPVSEGIVHTVVKQNGIIILDENKNAAQETFVISLTGRESDVIQVFFDDVLAYEETLGALR